MCMDYDVGQSEPATLRFNVRQCPYIGYIYSSVVYYKSVQIKCIRFIQQTKLNQFHREYRAKYKLFLHLK